MSEKRISVEFSQKDVQKALLTHLKDPTDLKLAETIVGYLAIQDNALPGLMKALMGIYPDTKYKKGDMVWVKFSTLPSWKMDKNQTKTLPHYSPETAYDREGRILAQITEVNVYNSSPYTIEFSVYEGGLIKQITYTVADHSIAFKEESFLNILDAVEKVDAPREEEDQPF